MPSGKDLVKHSLLALNSLSYSCSVLGAGRDRGSSKAMCVEMRLAQAVPGGSGMCREDLAGRLQPKGRAQGLALPAPSHPGSCFKTLLSSQGLRLACGK